MSDAPRYRNGDTTTVATATRDPVDSGQLHAMSGKHGTYCLLTPRGATSGSSRRGRWIVNSATCAGADPPNP
jgi:hypothetical protein